MEPWLDSLSEDWKSEQHSSSPVSKISGSRSHNSSIAFSKSQSRIPHLAQGRGKGSVNSNYLQPRSTRGLARSKASPVLAERTASNLNISAQAVFNNDLDSERKHGTSTLPRRASSAFSDSQQSVQHHTLQHRSLQDAQNDTPDWKRRLAGGEDVAKEGMDLFGPSKLEGIFMKPAATRDSSVATDHKVERKPWTPFNMPSGPSAFEQQQSFRTSRGRLPNMEVLQEVNEDDHSMLEDADIESSLIRKGSIRGLVKNRVQSLERARDQDSNHSSPQPKQLMANSEQRSFNDPRWRTVSGQEELMNEDLSPVTVSKRNTIRDRVVKDTLDIDADALQTNLASLNKEDRRSLSGSSDKSIQYGHPRARKDIMLHDESLGDFTSHSLPEDLSMGTQEFVLKGGYVNRKRGGYSRDTSFQRKILSSSASSSRFLPQTKAGPKAIPAVIRSSPPPYNRAEDLGLEDSRFSASAPVTPRRVQGTGLLLSPGKPRSSGSPLKLFGDRDTYTNNKLLRVLSHFEDADVPQPDPVEDNSLNGSEKDGNFRMSHFGKGDLNNFNFEQSVVREPPPIATMDGAQVSIFKVGELPDLMSSSRRGSKNGTRRIITPPQYNIAQIDFAAPPIHADQLEIEGKRVPNSPLKDRTPKRRRTLMKEANDLQPPAFIHVELSTEVVKLAGTKRKDSRADPAEPFANPDVLASRAMLRPIKAKRQSSIPIPTLNSQPSSNLGSVNKDLTEALAAELASFTNGVAQAANDSRKPSVTTKDYMEEANKVMQFIRAKGKPKSTLSNVTETIDISELNADAILDMEVEGDSTRDSFSRPPSRDGLHHVPRNRRHAEHDPEVASYLRKYQDQDDLDLLASTSVLGTLHFVDNKAAEEAALIPLDEDGQESEPSNIRIRNPNDPQRKRKHSLSDVQQSSQHDSHHHTSSGSSTRQSFPTASSGSSGHKGMITSGTVAIPDQVGVMKFDHLTKTWVKDRTSQPNPQIRDRREIQRTSDEDPFENIPDLSVDEKEHILTTKADQLRAQKPQNVFDTGKTQRSAQNSLRSEISEHEQRILNGEVSQPPSASVNMRKQARAVTIAFSSPVVSAAYPREPSVSDLDDDDTDLLPLDDSELALTSPASARKQATKAEAMPAWQSNLESLRLRGERQSLRFLPRPVSRIEEHEDEDNEQNLEMSMVHVSNPGTMTPANRQSHSALNIPKTANRMASSLMCLTPLSEFSLHQVDKAQNPEQSYVEERVHPTSLRQAHGSLALAVDDLVKAITDAESEEPFWENIQRLNLADKGLTTLHGLREYCPSLEEVSLARNNVGQLEGLPTSLRTLSIQGNCLSSLTSWGHLQNLQYVNISGNQLENLAGFSSLIHLRDLDASNNKIEDIRGIFDLAGLLSLRLSGNLLTSVDFEGAEMMRLTGLDLSHNKITSVRNLTSLPSLEELSLDCNNLSSFALPKEKQHMRLRGLSLSNNQLQAIDVIAFPAVERLYLDRNRISRIHGLQQAQYLDNLSIREQTNSPDIVNYIMSTPNECRSICLSLNPVSGGYLRLPHRPHYNLRLLEMACCGVASLPQDFGGFLPNCRILNLNFNAVKDLTPLRGMIKLRKLLLARNRVKRLRRTCLVLSRLKTLAAIDLRDNPLTVGFYAPIPTSGGLVVLSEQSAGMNARDSYALEGGSVELDEKWLRLLDEVTSLKRRTIELLLAENCEALMELDGMVFEREKVLNSDPVWKTLTNLGVLKKMEMPREMPTMVAKDEGDVEVTGLPLAVETTGREGHREERSVMME